MVLAINLQLRLNKDLPPLAYQKVRVVLALKYSLSNILTSFWQFLFRGLIKKHERKVASAAQANGPPDFYNMANVTPGPVNDYTGYTIYPGHTDGGDKFDSVQELNKKADEENVLPVNEAPLPPPAAVIKQ